MKAYAQIMFSFFPMNKRVEKTIVLPFLYKSIYLYLTPVVFTLIKTKLMIVIVSYAFVTV